MRIVLAYSGGLDTSVILAWLKETYDAEVVTYTCDVGQGGEVAEAEAKALATGAVAAVVDDRKLEFVRDAVFPAVRANAVYEGEYLLGTSLARPIITKGLVEAAREHGAQAVAHGATGKGNDQVRFELSTAALAPDLKTIAPWREWDLKGRMDLMAYAEARGIPVPTTKASPYSMDANLFHISYEGGILEDPWESPPPGMFRMTTDPDIAPDDPEEIVIGLRSGDAVSIDGVEMGPVEMLTELNQRAGRHGVGRIDIVENRFVGIKSRGVYETPGGTVMHKARRAVESIVLDREVLALRDSLAGKYAQIVYNGFWFAPERIELQRLMDSIAEPVTGEARLRLYKGSVTVLGRRSPNTRYDPEVATFEEDKVYRQFDAEGFINLNALRIRGYGEGS